ncbi:MAG: PocR ligand-binding domain-containing protein [Bacillota bacterium]|nr:PocR ligand-binding domain-containing protein [Bacillota bacterium]
MTSNQQKLYKLKSAIKDYELATGVNCYLIDDQGRGIGDRSYYQCHHFCSFVQQFDKTGICARDYLRKCSVAQKSNNPHVYQCPFGMLNIAVPILPDGNTVYFVSSGPLLYDTPDKTKLFSFLGCNPQSYSQEIDLILKEVPILNNDKMTALGNMLQRSVASVSSEAANVEEEDPLTALSKKLKQEFYQTLHPEFLITAQTLQKELDLLSKQDRENPELCQKALEITLSSFLKEVFKFNSRKETRCRAAIFFLTLSQTAQKYDISRESIFGSQYVNIKELLASTSFTTMNPLIYNTADCFRQVFFQKVKNNNTDLILETMSYIRQNYATVTLNDVAEHVTLTPTYFSYLFKKHSGQSYSEYLNKVRIEASKQSLREGLPMAEIAQNAGFSDQSYYIKVFKRFEGVSPTKWKQNL